MLHVQRKGLDCVLLCQYPVCSVVVANGSIIVHVSVDHFVLCADSCVDAFVDCMRRKLGFSR